MQGLSESVWAFYRRYKKPVLQILACGLLLNLFALCLPIFASFVYDKVLGNNIHETLWALVIGLMIVAALELSIRALRLLLAERFAQSSEAEIDHHIFQGLLVARLQNVPSAGRFLDRYKRLLSNRDLLSSTYLLSLVDLPFLALFLIVVAAVGGAIVFIPLLLGALILAANGLASIPAFAYDREQRKHDEQRFRVLMDMLTGHEAAVSSALGLELAARWGASCAQATNRLSLSRYWRGLGQSLSASGSFLSYVFVITAGVYMVDERMLTSGGLLAVSMLSSRAIASFSSVVTVVMRYHDFKVALREMNALLPPPRVDAENSASAPAALRGTILFNNVTCMLGEGKKPVLSGVSFKVEHGEMIGIAGIPGSGKTTLLRLVAGLFVPESGNVLIDHYPVSTLSADDLARTVGYKPQDLCLMEGTIEDNVRAGGAPLTPEERARSLDLSGLGWVFQQGDLNWHSEVGARGQCLSGGQRQMVALARALLRERPILLLDEPTNGLDVNLETHLAKVLLALKKKHTILVCTHSRALLSACDRIIVVGDGRILANGPRDKVLVA